MTQKEKVSKQITASATKRKTLVDLDTETQSPSVSDPVGKRTAAKPAKRRKTTKVRDIVEVLCQLLIKPQSRNLVNVARKRRF